MKNKILLEEISRIHQLMGKKLINEQWLGIAKAITTLSKTADEFADLLMKYSDDFTKLANATSDEEAIKILAKLSNSEQKLADEIIPRIMQSLPEDVAKEIANIANMAQKELDKGQPRNIVDSLVDKRLNAIKTEFEGVKTAAKKNIKDILDGYKPPKPPTPVPLVDETLQEQMKRVFNAWDEIAPGSLSTKDKILLNDLWFRGLRAKINYLLNNLMNQSSGKMMEKSMEKIVALLKKASKLGEDFENKKIIWKTIDSEIEALRKNEDFAKDQVYKLISQEIDKKLGPGRGYKFVEELKKNDPLGEKSQSYWSYLVNDTYIGKMFPSISKSGEKLSGIKNFIHRLFMTITTGNPRKVTEVFDEFFKKFGTVKGFMRWYGMLWLVHRTIWPAFLAGVDTLYTHAFIENPNLKFESWWKTYENYLKERFFDMFAPVVEQYNKESGEKLPTGERKFNLPQTLKAFNWFWDEVSSGLDWHVGGGTRRLFNRLEERARTEARSLNIPGTEDIPNLFGKYKNELPSFVDFLIDANYPVEEAEKATYNPELKVYITPDNYQYEFKNGDFEPKSTN